jgi:hypothetical protein
MAAAVHHHSRLPRTLLSQLSFESVPDSDERDELRSLLLLHYVNSLAAQQRQGPRNASGKRFALELACEPSNVCELRVRCDDVLLPPQLVPSNCSVGRFARSSRCSLLCRAGSNHVQVRPPADLIDVCRKLGQHGWNVHLLRVLARDVRPMYILDHVLLLDT